MRVPRVRVTSQISCDDVTMLIKKDRPERQCRNERLMVALMND